MNKSHISQDVSDVLAKYPNDIRNRLLEVRSLIFSISEGNDIIGKLTETLKWGEISYLTEETKSGSTVRLGYKKSNPENFYVYFNCKTNLIDTFNFLYGDILVSEGKRALVFNVQESIAKEPLTHCLTLALTYHHDKRHQK